MAISLYQQYKSKCQLNNISRNVFYNRIRRGWTGEKASTIPVKRYAIKDLEI